MRVPDGVTDSVRVVRGTGYAIVPEDAGLTLEFVSGAAVVVVAPASLPSGFACGLAQMGDGQLTVTAGSGVTLTHFGGPKSAGKNAEMALRVRSNNGGASINLVGGVA